MENGRDPGLAVTTTPTLLLGELSALYVTIATLSLQFRLKKGIETFLSSLSGGLTALRCLQ